MDNLPSICTPGHYGGTGFDIMSSSGPGPHIDMELPVLPMSLGEATVKLVFSLAVLGVFIWLTSDSE